MSLQELRKQALQLCGKRSPSNYKNKMTKTKTKIGTLDSTKKGRAIVDFIKTPRLSKGKFDLAGCLGELLRSSMS
jgi:hypothetical protein